MSQVLFKPVTQESDWGPAARALLEALVADNHIQLESDLVLKVHTGEPGNITFVRPNHFDPIIDYLESYQVHPTYMETNMANGGRDEGHRHRQIAADHGFTRIPFEVADGDDGRDHVLVPIKNGKHFKECKIATKLHQHDQVLVLSHFKGHSMTGYGGAIKMLGIGFASARGKTDAHAVLQIPDDQKIDWDKAVLDGNWAAAHVKWNDDYVYHDHDFMERTAEYALAAHKPGHLHIVFAVNLVKDCDCDGEPMEPIYKDLGIFASLDPVAVDQAILDMLKDREGKPAYWGGYILEYAEKIGLGSRQYQLKTL